MRKKIEPFVEIEKEWNLFERQYNGFYYWQYIRFSLCESLYGSRYEQEKSIQKKSGILKIIFYELPVLFKRSLRDIKLLLGHKNIDVIVFRQLAIKDYFFDSWKFPEYITKYEFRACEEKNDSKNIHILGLPQLQCIVMRRLARFGIGKKLNDESELNFLKSLRNNFVKEFGQCMPVEEIEELIITNYYIHKYYGKYYERLIKRLKCRAILTIVYYNYLLYPAYEIAKKHGIPIIELQHGVINNHESYWFEDNRGVNNYTPDYLLTYGDIHNTWVKLVGGVKTISVGLPYQETMIKELTDITPKLNVVIFYPETEPIFEKLIEDFVNLCPQYKIIVKLHPLQFGHVKEFFPNIAGNEKIEFIESQDKGIYYWLKYAKHHVMGGTTVGLEAMAFDHCNVCIFNKVQHDQTQCLLDWGVARSFDSVYELEKLINHPIEDMPDLYDIRNKLWKRNARKNIEEFFINVSKNNWVLK